MAARTSFHEEKLQPGQHVVVTQDVLERVADLARLRRAALLSHPSFSSRDKTIKHASCEYD